MNKVFILPALLVAGIVTTAQATTMTGLADWCVNLNGDWTTACNGEGLGGSSGPAPGGINLSQFDTTAEPSTNALGQVVVTLSANENNQYSAFYADYDLDYSSFGSFNDVATIFNVGSLPAGASYEVNDPNSSSIGSDIVGFSSSSQFGDYNDGGTASGPPNPCCDVAFALGFTGLNVAAGGTGTVTYTISTTAPQSGFYIEQTNETNGDSIFLSAVVNIQNPSGPSTPEPSTFVLGLGAIGAALLMGRVRRARNQA